jgi:hypothetical protein
MSGYCGELTTEALRTQGIREFIVKPFTPQIIAEVLRRVLSGETTPSSSN